MRDRGESRTWVRRASGWIPALALTLVAVPASATTYFVQSGGLALAFGCPTQFSCGTGGEIFELDTSLVSTSGTLDFDPGLLTLDFNLTYPEATLDSVGGGEHNGVSQIILHDIVYSASGLSLTSAGGGVYDVVAATTSVSGTYTTIGSQGAGPLPLNASQVFVSGQCNSLPPGLTCGLTFSPFLDFNALYGGPTAETLYFQHFLNDNAVTPEPGAFLLFVSGLSLLTLRLRR